jgi:hypothetical protein
MPYSQFSLDAFRANLVNGGARDNLFLVTGNFPGGASTAINAVAGVAGAIFGGGAANVVNALGSIGGGNPNAQIQFLCKAAQVPESKMDIITYPYMGRNLKIPSDRSFADWTIQVYNDGTYGLRKAFESWSNLMNTYEGNVGPNASNTYLTDWFVSPLTREGNPITTYKMAGCWPNTIGLVDLSMDAKSSPSQFNVTMSYQYFTVLGVTT